MSNILVVNGPNLNILGTREPKYYGSTTLSQIEADLHARALEKKVEVSFFQSNHEGQIIDKIHEAQQYAHGIIINAGAYTHTSIAIRDALTAVKIPTVEVHLSNVYAREDFRHKSMLAPVVLGQISGFGAYSYILALSAILNFLESGDLNENKIRKN